LEGRENVPVSFTHWRMLRAPTRHSGVVYGSRTDPFGRLTLLAHVLGFDHPGTGARMRFVSPAPAAFTKRRP